MAGQSGRRLTVAFALLCAAALPAVLHRFPPETSLWYPACPFHRWTGLLCPGCGATRCLAALTHGDLTAAFHANALFLLLLPLLLLYLAAAIRRAWTGATTIFPTVPPRLTAALVTLALSWGVARNLI